MRPATFLRHIAAIACGASSAWVMAQAPQLQTLLTTTPAATTAAISAPYQDRVIEGISPVDSGELAERSYNRQGLPRSLYVETYAERRGVGSTTAQQGLRLSGFQETLYWGTFSGQIDWQRGQSTAPGLAMRSSSKLTGVVSQLGMSVEAPWGGVWRLSNTAGNTAVPVPDMSRQGTRFGLPTSAMLGIATQATQLSPPTTQQSASSFSLSAAWGKAGQLGGFPVASFRTTGGSYSYLSATQRLAIVPGGSAWEMQAALAQSTADNTRQPNGATLRPGTRSLYAAVRRESTDTGWQQINFLGSHASTLTGATATTPSSANAGLWLDGGFRSGAHQNQWGVFYLEPRLNWLDGAVVNDLQGGYWRHLWRSRQWSSESNLELFSPVQNNTPSGFFASQSLRYQYSTLTSFGANLNIRRYNANSQSAQLFSQWTSGLGSTRAQVEIASAEGGDTLVRTQLDQEWSAAQALRLSTSLSVDREKRQGIITRGWGLAASLDWAITPGLNFTNTINSRSTLGNNGQVQYTLNSGLTWQLAPQWSLNATVFAVQGNPQTGSVVQSPLNPVVSPSTSLQDKGIFVSLRYSQAAGSAQAPLGGSLGAAAGGIKGTVFLDDNANSQKEASEKGVAQLTVLLNNRFSTQTDAQGRFEFPYVAAGQHTIEVVSDNLPLPWTLPQNGKRALRVFTRETTQVDVAAEKP